MFVGTDKENKELDVGGCEKGADVMDVVFPLSGIGAVSVNDVAIEGSVVGVGSGWDVCRRVPLRSLPLDGDDSELNRDDKLGGLDVGVARCSSLALPEDQDALGPSVPATPLWELDPLRECRVFFAESVTEAADG